MKLILVALSVAVLFAIPSRGAPDQVCKEGEEYMSCGTACPDTCETIISQAQGNRPCTMNCVPGCFCKQGLVRDNVAGKCVEIFMCQHPRDTVQDASAGGGAMALMASAKWLVTFTVMAALAGRQLL